jgi:2-succinyl-5-enolpyruvyl-6-hydroxy-3-cyclohexene-1-carboxylate synthase
MTGWDAADVQAAFCSVLVDEWSRGGVTDAVVAPGSRSTPMVMALDADPRIRVHVVLDERSAGFVALGLGLASGRPAVVATTSGTAAVELHPAVVEASHAGVPLIAVTSDRPPELHGVGAPQTVEQEGLYGAAVRWAVSPGVAEWAASGSWRSLASRCVAEAAGGAEGPGPVQCNLAFREPLLGRGQRVPLPPGRPGAAPWHLRTAACRGDPPAAAMKFLAAHAGGRGLIVAGAGSGPAGDDGSALVTAARSLGWPLFADPRSGCRVATEPVVAAADALLRVPEVAAWRPDVVLRLGAPWASKVLGQWLAGLGGAGVPQVLVDPWGRWADPDRQVGQVVVADPGVVTAALQRMAGSGAGVEKTMGSGSPPATGWVEQWIAVEQAAQRALGGLLDEGGALSLSEPGVARGVVAGLEEGSLLLVSSSMPVRDVEWYSAPRQKITLLSNRGANGIDGVVSTAVGASLGSGRPVVALVGDLAFLYDAGALLSAANRDVAVTIVVVDNDGGGIFSFLPQAEALPAGQFERYWGTPHGIDLLAVAAAYGAEVMDVSDRAGLDRVMGQAGRAGVRVARVRSDRVANVQVHDRLHAAVAAAVGGAISRG